MSDKSISIITPTIGRLSLEQTINSVYNQLADDDEIIVVGDGKCNIAAAICNKYEKVKYFEIQKSGCYGALCRDFGINAAKNPFIWFLDDDDSALPESIATIKSSIDPGKDKMYLFKMKNPNVWITKNLIVGNLSSQTIVVPKRQDLPRWGLQYAGDYHFAKACAEFLNVVWIDKVIAHRNLFRG